MIAIILAATAIAAPAYQHAHPDVPSVASTPCADLATTTAAPVAVASSTPCSESLNLATPTAVTTPCPDALATTTQNLATTPTETPCSETLNLAKPIETPIQTPTAPSGYGAYGNNLATSTLNAGLLSNNANGAGISAALVAALFAVAF